MPDCYGCARTACKLAGGWVGVCVCVCVFVCVCARASVRVHMCSLLT